MDLGGVGCVFEYNYDFVREGLGVKVWSVGMN